MKRLDAGATHMSAADFDELLSTMKSVQRAVGPESKAGRLVNQVVDEGKKAVEKAIPPELHNDLLAARKTIQEYIGSDELMKELGINRNKPQKTNPAAVAERLSRSNNLSASVLQRLSKVNPEIPREVGRLKLEKILKPESALEASPTQMLKQFEDLGPTTRKLYFGENEKDIHNYLAAQNKINKTATHVMGGDEIGQAASVLGSGIISGPVSFFGKMVLPSQTAKILTSPGGAKVLTQAYGLGGIPKATAAAARAAVMARYLELHNQESGPDQNSYMDPTKDMDISVAAPAK